MEVIYLLAAVAALVLVWLMTRRWFWVLALFLGALAAFFATLASIVHFQILGALGFAVLAWVLACCFSAVSGA